MVSIYDVINTTSNDKASQELRRVLKETFDINIQEGCILKYLNLRISQSQIGFGIDQTNNKIELATEWFPYVKVR